MEIHQYPLGVTRSPAEKLTGIPSKGFIQVLRADDSATLRIQSPNGYGTLAAPGVVLPAHKGIYLQTEDEDVTPANVVEKRGLLMLAWYETQAEIIPLSTENLMLPTRRLVSNGADNAIAFADVNPKPETIHYVTGILLTYSGGNPAGSALSSLSLSEVDPGASVFNQLFGFSFNPGQPASRPNAPFWFPTPMFTQPGWGLRLTLPASGTVGSFSNGQIFGGSIHV